MVGEPNFLRINETHIGGVWQLIKLLDEEQCEISFTDLQSESEVAQWVNNPAHLVYVAVTPLNEILAVVRGRRQISLEQSHAVFLTAATAPSARGCGLAANLTNFALDAMKAEGVNTARIYVYSDNKASLKSVSKLGFEHSGTVYRHHICQKTHQYVDDLIFHKFLD